MILAAIYLIASEWEDNEVLFWSNTHGWGWIEDATVYTDIDRNSGVNLPRNGYWLRITDEGITRLETAPTPHPVT